MKHISFVVPVFNEEANLREFYQRLTDIMSALPYEYDLTFVDDGSKDSSAVILAELVRNDERVQAYLLSRNYGHQLALTCGLDYADGDAVITMDGDLQHPPETLVEMYKLWKQGFQVVEGVKATRGKESAIHKLFAKTFYKIISDATKIDMSRASDFKLLDRQVVDAFIALPERQVFFRALSSWVGFKTTYVEFDVQEREAGVSKWSFKSLFKYAINNITSFTVAPMQIVTGCGMFLFVFSIIFGIFSLVKYFSGKSLEGFTTVILLLLIIGSILMMSLGVIGFYISKIYEEVKMRPRYIVAKTTDDNNEK